jgi:hypothetical protein
MGGRVVQTARILTLNTFGRRGDWESRRVALCRQLAAVDADLIAFKLVMRPSQADQSQEALQDGYVVVHHPSASTPGSAMSRRPGSPSRSNGSPDARSRRSSAASTLTPISPANCSCCTPTPQHLPPRTPTPDCGTSSTASATTSAGKAAAESTTTSSRDSHGLVAMGEP